MISGWVLSHKEDNAYISIISKRDVNLGNSLYRHCVLVIKGFEMFQEVEKFLDIWKLKAKFISFQVSVI